MPRPGRLTLRLGACLALAATLLGLFALPPNGARLALAAPLDRPSFVVIQTDDQTLDSIEAMPNTWQLLSGRGLSFDRYYVPYPLCCPSRVSLLTGRYAHNHNVRGNVQPSGGFTGFTSRGAVSHNLATWLDGAGYRTIHIGKFLNGYGDPPYDDGTSVPPGWDAWHTVLAADTNHYYYGYSLNVNGRIEGPFGDPGSWETREYGIRDDPSCAPFPAVNELPCNYLTDRLTNVAAAEILATPRSRPFYLQLDYTSPHGDYRRPAGPEPASRHYNLYSGGGLPHRSWAGFDEVNVRDKPRFIRRAARLTAEEKRHYGVYYRKQLEAIRSVDDGVQSVITALGMMHRLRNTYVILLSDNGFFFGEHRLLGGKFLAYEPATHLPLIIRGPGIRPGSHTEQLAANIDIAPTVLQLARVRPDRSLDGRSLVPALRRPDQVRRRAVLFESFVETSDVEAHGLERPGRGAVATASVLAPPKDYSGIRLDNYKYIAWPSGEQELYDLDRDPAELNSLVRVRNFDPIRAFLHRQMLRLRHCAGRTCRAWIRRLPLTRSEARRAKAQRRHGSRLPGGQGPNGVFGSGAF